MPVRYERDDARRRIVVTIQGPFALPDFLAVIGRQQVDHSWGYGILYDLRGMTGQPTAADLRQSLSLAAQPDEPRGRVAVVTGDPAMYRRACAYAALGRAGISGRRARPDPPFQLTIEPKRNMQKCERTGFEGICAATMKERILNAAGL
jgi:hypothetical protein